MRCGAASLFTPHAQPVTDFLFSPVRVDGDCLSLYSRTLWSVVQQSATPASQSTADRRTTPIARAERPPPSLLIALATARLDCRPLVIRHGGVPAAPHPPGSQLRDDGRGHRRRRRYRKAARSRIGSVEGGGAVPGAGCCEGRAGGVVSKCKCVMRGDGVVVEAAARGGC